MGYQPPYRITPAVLTQVSRISEIIGIYNAQTDDNLTPYLRRENRIRTIQASLAIENNTLSLEQVTAVIDGRRVLGHPREIQEVRNAFTAYEAIPEWNASSEGDPLQAHGLLMHGLIDNAGRYRSSSVGIFRGETLVHMAPPASQIPRLMNDLLTWLRTTDEHPLVSSCVFHYEFEFIHPFADGNGRMGRLWQTLILRQWKSLLAYLPVETVIRERQTDYYHVLAEADRLADATHFIEFMLQALHDALHEAGTTDQATDQVTDQVTALINALGQNELGSSELMQVLGLMHRPTFRSNYLNPGLEQGWIERTQPDAPRSPTQSYRLSARGRQRWLHNRAVRPL